MKRCWVQCQQKQFYIELDDKIMKERKTQYNVEQHSNETKQSFEAN